MHFIIAQSDTSTFPR